MANSYLDIVYRSLERDGQMNDQSYYTEILTQDLEKNHATVCEKQTTKQNQISGLPFSY